MRETSCVERVSGSVDKKMVCFLDIYSIIEERKAGNPAGRGK